MSELNKMFANENILIFRQLTLFSFASSFAEMPTFIIHKNEAEFTTSSLILKLHTLPYD